MAAGERRLCGVRWDNPDLYQLIIDGPTLGVEACIDVIIPASRTPCGGESVSSKLARRAMTAPGAW
jgi:hypothetical protein